MLGTDGKLLGTRQPLLENARYAAGDQRYIFDVTTIGSGRFQLTLEAINAAYPAEKESREGLGSPVSPCWLVRPGQAT
ncbi:MAG: hypothetical protein IPL70_15585 [Uliginosibacterium sp.]|nr:hypothetical protein [Uliginosibacterium sp.]